MKKLIIVILFIVIIIGVTVLGIRFLNKTDADFPHFKQACLKFNGTSYGFAEENFNISFHFLDEKLVSEMSDSSNIKEMKIIDDKKNKFDVNITKIKTDKLNLSYSKDEYFLRNIFTTVVFDKIGLYKINEVQIEYMDNSIEKFDVGNLNIIIEDKNTNISKYLYFRTQRVIPADKNDKKYCGFSQILFCINDADTNIDKIRLTDFDLGIDGIEVDSKKLEILDKYADDEVLNYYYQNRVPINLVDNLSNKFEPLEISLEVNNVKTFVISINSENVEKEPYIYVITPVMTYEVDGNTYTLRANKSNYITPMVSQDENNGGMNVVKYIEEFGL